jgi:hypothetical protein
MTVLAALLKWIIENPRFVRVSLVAAALLAVALWIFHKGETDARRADVSREISTAIHMKEQYDEIGNHRPDNSRLLDLLRTGRF